ncbi:hypothetical protein F2Q69_00044791 [Brassica cretica]|uniref:Phytocyanin domain-containing protein n=1 Tax=Brassica cretica TaxID=69181 RepID=A0A8S9NEJ6_BRACR|nr:hypothetical protein F2Q69_00044791 [Brassica cretica]
MRMMSFLFAMRMSFVVLSGCCSAKIYKVGDSEGWTAKEDVYYAWAETDHKEFHVGDSLVFEYDPIINDVTHVSGVLECRDSHGTRLSLLHHLESISVRIGTEARSSCHPRPVTSGSSTTTEQDPSCRKYVQDTLIFKYDNQVSDVYEINGDLEFMTCDPTSPVAVHKTGHDLVRLTEPGVHYFITSHSGSCEAVLKLRVMVGPQHKAVAFPNFPKKVDLSAMERLNNWLKTFKPQRHH